MREREPWVGRGVRFLFFGRNVGSGKGGQGRQECSWGWSDVL